LLLIKQTIPINQAVFFHLREKVQQPDQVNHLYPCSALSGLRYNSTAVSVRPKLAVQKYQCLIYLHRRSLTVMIVN